MGKKILILGGSGYLGSILVPYLLSKNYKICVYDNLMYDQTTLLECCQMDNFEFIYGDICDYQKINKIIKKYDIVYPLASIVGAPACNLKPKLSRLINYEAQLNILDNTSKEQIVIYPTTNSGYGIGSKKELCTEESQLNPISEYGKLKVDVEKAFLDKGNSVTLRLATVFGMSPRMRMDLLVNDFVYRAVKDRSIILFEEKFRRNFIHIKDVTNAFEFCIDNYEIMKGEPYNIGLSSANINKLELANKIKEHVKDLHIHIAKIGEDPDKRDYIVSNEKIELLGWHPYKSLDDGIRELIQGYKMIKPNRFTNVI